MNGKGLAAGGGLGTVGLLVYQIVLVFIPLQLGAGSEEESSVARMAIATLAGIGASTLVGYVTQRLKATKVVAPVALVFLLATTGCAFQITGQGLQTSVGTARTATCTELEKETNPEHQECHEARGGVISAEGAGLIKNILGPIAGIMKILSGGIGG